MLRIDVSRKKKYINVTICKNNWNLNSSFFFLDSLASRVSILPKMRNVGNCKMVDESQKDTSHGNSAQDLQEDIKEDNSRNELLLDPKSKMAHQEKSGKVSWNSDEERESSKDSYLNKDQGKSCEASANKKIKDWGDQELGNEEDEKYAGVHWGYEETKVFLAILSEASFSEKLRTCHRNSQVYCAIAERLQEHGFLRTLEQCRYRFKNLQTSYRKARTSHPPGTCPFYKEIAALMHFRTAIEPTYAMKEIICPLGSMNGDSDSQGQEPESWEQGNPGKVTTAKDCEKKEMGLQMFTQEPKDLRATSFFLNRTGVHWGYEETKAFLAILSESQFYEKLRTHHPN
ncbi:zinc finger and SCAN domain-containing protein 20-like isoform X3 [Sminthopsis crassicaudata]|uniref:zinc finger and SCAN domain-containing protein 20-like isoform X3 n=1 Tax=Sminthopsis crassicaudata TaxID=9301 RepID=UPI003D68414C